MGFFFGVQYYSEDIKHRINNLSHSSEWNVRDISLSGRASNLQYPNSVQIFRISVLFMTFQYFSENLAYYAPIMLILKPKLQYLVDSFSTLPLKSTQVLKNQYGWRLCSGYIFTRLRLVKYLAIYSFISSCFK